MDRDLAKAANVICHAGCLVIPSFDVRPSDLSRWRFSEGGGWKVLMSEEIADQRNIYIYINSVVGLNTEEVDGPAGMCAKEREAGFFTGALEVGGEVVLRLWR